MHNEVVRTSGPQIITFSKYFIENADELARKTGYEIVYSLEPGKDYCVFSAHDAAAELLDFQNRYQTTYTIYQSENIESAFFTRSYIQLLQRNIVLQYSPHTAALCKERFGITTSGYFNFDYRPISVPGRKRTIDLLFFGMLTQKRYDILREIQNRFPTLNMVVAADLFHVALDDTLSYTRFVLNISAYENNALETHRINKALACGCRVISNYSADQKMNAKYQNLVNFCGRTISDYVEAVTRWVISG